MSPDSKYTVFVDVYSDKLAVDYNEYESKKPVVLDLPDAADQAVVLALVKDPNFWTNFLASLSAALTQQKDL